MTTTTSRTGLNMDTNTGPLASTHHTMTANAIPEIIIPYNRRNQLTNKIDKKKKKREQNLVMSFVYLPKRCGQTV